MCFAARNLVEYKESYYPLQLSELWIYTRPHLRKQPRTEDREKDMQNMLGQ